MSTFAWTIRPAELADAGMLAEVHVTAWRETYTGIVDDAVLATFDVAERRDVWTRALRPGRDDDRVIMVADAAMGIVGFAMAVPSRHTPSARDRELASLYTPASVHGTGIGAALLTAAVGEGPAEVWLAAANDRTAAFYRKHGFVEDGGTRVHERWGIPDKRMVR